jgi:hypothetical protein
MWKWYFKIITYGNYVEEYKNEIILCRFWQVCCKISCDVNATNNAKLQVTLSASVFWLKLIECGLKCVGKRFSVGKINVGCWCVILTFFFCWGRTCPGKLMNLIRHTHIRTFLFPKEKQNLKIWGFYRSAYEAWVFLVSVEGSRDILRNVSKQPRK